jgi:hypothetical protein
VRKCEGKRPVARTVHRWEDDIGTDLEKIRWDGVEWINLAQDRDQWWSVLETAIKFEDRQMLGVS